MNHTGDYDAALDHICDHHQTRLLWLMAQTLDHAGTVTNGTVALAVLAALRDDLATVRAGCAGRPNLFHNHDCGQRGVTPSGDQQ